MGTNLPVEGGLPAMDQEVVRIPFGLVNAYLVRGARGDVLVDTGLPGMSGRLMRGMGVDPDRLAAIVLTHTHLDHVGNLPQLRRLTSAPVLVHRLEAPLLEAGQVVVPAGQTWLARLAMGCCTPFARLMRLPSVTPDVIVDDELSLEDYGVKGSLLHTPGHTHGSISIILENGDAIVGDLCQNAFGFGMGAGRIIPPLADVPQALAASWSRLIERGVRRLFPGHGAPFAVEHLLRVKNRLD